MTPRERKIKKDVWDILKKAYGIPFEKPSSGPQDELTREIMKYIISKYRVKREYEKDFDEPKEEEPCT